MKLKDPKRKKAKKKRKLCIPEKIPPLPAPTDPLADEIASLHIDQFPKQTTDRQRDRNIREPLSPPTTELNLLKCEMISSSHISQCPPSNNKLPSSHTCPSHFSLNRPLSNIQFPWTLGAVCGYFKSLARLSDPPTLWLQNELIIIKIIIKNPHQY